MARVIDLADGHPYVGDMVAVVDETSPDMGAGLYYAVSTAVLLDPQQVRVAVDQLFADVPDRRRRFHWSQEGLAAKTRIVEVMETTGVVAHCRYQSVGRRGTKSARRALVPAIADAAYGEGATHLIIEAGDRHTNLRDRDALLDHYRGRGGVPFHYDWRTKAEPLLWLADAISGAVKDHLTEDDPSWLARLIAAGVAQHPAYLAEPKKA
ncbi:MAG: hypothetical protein GY701_23320 [Sulfitobacter sp.]|nr:hypothetical protein [Sulfitobacter sp.]MCP4106524.1 hypothetical protein [Desulfobacteraceae bacterium]